MRGFLTIGLFMHEYPGVMSWRNAWNSKKIEVNLTFVRLNVYVLLIKNTDDKKFVIKCA